MNRYFSTDARNNITYNTIYAIFCVIVIVCSRTEKEEFSFWVMAIITELVKVHWVNLGHQGMQIEHHTIHRCLNHHDLELWDLSLLLKLASREVIISVLSARSQGCTRWQALSVSCYLAVIILRSMLNSTNLNRFMFCDTLLMLNLTISIDSLPFSMACTLIQCENVLSRWRKCYCASSS